jgi:transposase
LKSFSAEGFPLMQRREPLKVIGYNPPGAFLEEVRMELMKVAEVVASEEAALGWLMEVGLVERAERCWACGGSRVVLVRRMSWKCRDCGRERSVRRGSLLARFKLSPRQFVLGLKLFEMEVSAVRAARELGVAYRTAWKLFTVLRQALAKAERGQELLSGEVEADESYFGGRKRGKRGRGAAGKTPVFGILERGGKVHVEVVPSVRASELRSLLVAKVKRGSLVYTDQFKGYDGLVAYGFRHERIDKTTRFANGRVYLNGIEGFWSFAKERLAKFHGMSVSHFPLYLKELQFRYNHRPNCFASILQAVKAFVEDHD